MQVSGPGSIEVWETKEEQIHPPGPEHNWQESVVLFWCDHKQGIGGFYRIGHEVKHASGPLATLWSLTFTPEGLFRKSNFLPLQPEHRSPTAYTAGDGSPTFQYTDHAVWTLNEDGLTAELHVQDFHPGIDGYPKGGDLAKVAPAHMEVTGTVTGQLTAHGHTYTVDGLAVRDRGWGQRDWDEVRSHRWIAGTFGPDLSFVAIAFHSRGDNLYTFGWVVKNDTVVFAKNLDILYYLEIDGIGVRGGTLHMELNDGDVLDMTFEPQTPSFVFHHHNVSPSDTPCIAKIGDRTGIAILEMTNNRQHGTNHAKISQRAIVENGWHTRQSK